MKRDEPSPAQMSQVFALVALFCFALSLLMKSDGCHGCRDRRMFTRAVERAEHRGGAYILVLACGHEEPARGKYPLSSQYCEQCERENDEWRRETYGSQQ